MQEIMDKIFEIAAKYEKKTIIEMALKGSEEMGELAEAILSYQNVPGCSYKKLTKDDVTEEACDVLIVVLAILSRTKISQDKVKEIMNNKIDKWLKQAMKNNNI